MANRHVLNLSDTQNNQGLPYIQMRVVLEPKSPLPHLSDTVIHRDVGRTQMRTSNNSSLQRRLTKPNKIQLSSLHVISTISTTFLFHPHNSTLYNP